MNETASSGRGRRPAPPRPARVRLRPAILGFLLVGALGRAGEAAAAPVTVGLGFGADIPTVPIVDTLTIDRGDPLGFALTVPVLIGAVRIEPQLTWTDVSHDDGMPPAGADPCSRGDVAPGAPRTLVGCEVVDAGDGGRAGIGLTLGPAWSIGTRARLWTGPWAGATFRGSPGQPDWSLGAILGGEFFLDRRFTFGLDVRAAYTTVESGGAHTKTTSLAGTRHDYARGWTVGVDGVAAFRIYLN